MLKTRLIPCLDVADGRVVKGVNFVGLHDAGDPLRPPRDTMPRARTKFVFWTSSDPRNRGTMFDMVRRTAEQCFIPLTVGGGVRTVEDVRALLLAGADKVSFNSALWPIDVVVRPQIILAANALSARLMQKPSPPANGNCSRWGPQTHRD